MDHDESILIICADSSLTRQYFSELEQSGAKRRLLLAVSVAEARLAFQRLAPAVILLDASAQASAHANTWPDGSDNALEAAISMLIEDAPVVLVAVPQQQRTLAYLIASGAVDFVAREGNFVPVAVALVERRMRLAVQGDSATLRGRRPTEEFGEMLRHEVNNPLTGILGNAELLLARHDPLPAAAIARVETIAALAVRLRETVRRLSQACGTDQASGVEKVEKRRAAEISHRTAHARLHPKALAAARTSAGRPGPVPVPFRVQDPVEE
jgi:nitrogen-specific signal transduction histidine kinase